MIETYTYFTHDNGGRSFKVNVSSDNSVAIYNNYKDVLVLKEQFDEIYIGESPKCQFTEYSAGFGDDFIGNSIAYIKDNVCTFIGSTRVFRFHFEKDEKVQYYVSMVGNNDVPYPYLITNKYIYFTEDQTRMQTKHISDVRSCYKECFYTLYCYNNAFSSLMEKMDNIEVAYQIKWQ